jgi:hypothetical protein
MPGSESSAAPSPLGIGTPNTASKTPRRQRSTVKKLAGQSRLLGCQRSENFVSLVGIHLPGFVGVFECRADGGIALAEVGG